MKKNRLRVWMTILATTMGCAFLIVLASVGFGIQKSATDEMLQYQLLTEIRVNGKNVNDQYQEMKKEDIQQLMENDRLKAVVTRIYFPTAVDLKMADRNGSTQTILTNMEEELKADFELKEGRVPEAKNEVIVGYHFAKSLLTEEEKRQEERYYETYEGELPEGFEGDLLNQEVTVIVSKDEDGEMIEEAFNFTIVGIGKEPSRDWMEDRKIYISNEFQESFFAAGLWKEELEHRQHRLYDEVLVYVSKVSDVEPVTNELKESGFYVYSISEELDRMNILFTVFKAGLIFVGTIAVLIASIGIFNTMTMAVTERTQEIGIMKAIGGDPGVIRSMFLIESAYIGVIGSIIGVVISYLVSWAANFLLPIILVATMDVEGPIDFTFSYIPLSLVVISATISIGVAIISGLRPAVKATNINVLSALRREI